MYNEYGLKLLMEGEGLYQANLNNAHGNPASSANVYIKEIIKNHVIIQGGEAFYEKYGFFK